MKSALVIGAGGLGCPALLGLAAAGLRRVAILEPDRVELSNLQRQILYGEEDVGRSKAECAAAALRARFRDLDVEVHARAFDASTHALVSQYDVVLDGTDHFDTKLAISDVCTDRGVDYVFAGVVGFEAQVLAVRPGRSACVRCLFDEAPPPGAAPTCAELGILGPIAGIAGAKQARAALALLSGAAATVTDRIWVYDGRAHRAREIPLRRAADCRGCGSRRAFRGMKEEMTFRPEEAPALDLSGLVCPNTYIEARKALARLPSGARLWIHLTSDEAARNVPKSAIAAGHKVLAQTSDGRTHRVLLERGHDMPITVRIPTPLRKYTDGKDVVQVPGNTVRAVIDELDKVHPGLKERLCDDKGLRRFVNVYYKDEDIRFLDNIDTKLDDGSEISVVPAIAGGI